MYLIFCHHTTLQPWGYSVPIFYIHSIVLPFKIITIALTQKWVKASGKQTEKVKEKPTTHLYEINIMLSNIQLAVC